MGDGCLPFCFDNRGINHGDQTEISAVTNSRFFLVLFGDLPIVFVSLDLTNALIGGFHSGRGYGSGIFNPWLISMQVASRHAIALLLGERKRTIRVFFYLQCMV